MTLAPSFTRLVTLSLTLLTSSAYAQSQTLKSRAELTQFDETSRYEDVLHFIDELQRRSSLIRVEIFGHSHEGRALPLVILSDPPISQPREAASSGKLLVFIMADLHAGEVEGKEAAQHLARRILTGDLRTL